MLCALCDDSDVRGLLPLCIEPPFSLWKTMLLRPSRVPTPPPPDTWCQLDPSHSRSKTELRRWKEVIISGLISP